VSDFPDRLAKQGYRFAPDTRIWSKPGFDGIPYSDGDEAEERIAEIVGRAADLSILSTELAQHCADWPSRYHLSGARANLMRPFASSLRGDVLEIGAGCGAITRFLGECGGRVLALEGSPRRAEIAAARTRDLDSVNVLAEDFGRFEWSPDFDAITLVGVLEYANLFICAANPPLALLQRIRSLLKPTGMLIIAIENQLGLKYFAGVEEDHLGTPMYGIEGRYRSDQPQTFGRAVLSEMLRQAGFETCEFLVQAADFRHYASRSGKHGFRCRRLRVADRTPGSAVAGELRFLAGTDMAHRLL
jgi:SAM-dependent methyltransferase